MITKPEIRVDSIYIVYIFKDKINLHDWNVDESNIHSMLLQLRENSFEKIHPNIILENCIAWTIMKT